MKRKLTDRAIKGAKPKPDGKPCSLADGGGLYLLVKGSGKYWRYDYQHNDKRKTLSIGNYQEIGLHEARERHMEARALLARGIDPSEHKRALKAVKSEIIRNSFEAIAREWFTRNKPTWSEGHAARTISYLERDVFPWLGSTAINDIKAGDIIRIVQRVEDRGAGDAARRVKQYIRQVCKYAKVMGLAESNPAADIDTKTILKPRIKKNFATITDPVKVGQLLRDMDAYQGSFVVRCALQLSPLVMLRPGELRAAEWAEIDLEAATWTIPIRRMKAPTHEKQANQTAHVVPLSWQAVEVFRELYPLTGRFQFVFPSARGASRPMSENAVRVALRALGYDNDTMTPHGFRGMASTLLNRMRGEDNQRRWDDDLIEQQLAHKDSSVRGAYNRADSTEAISQRREMLQAWADYLDGLRAKQGLVVPFRTRGE